MAITRYTIHEHLANKAGRHYDLRLQHGNDVQSFALPKAMLPDNEHVYLAVKTHLDKDDLSALKFEGQIPSGEYGGGRIIIFESGQYQIIEWLPDDSKIIFYVPKQYPTQQLVGKYYLIQTSKNKNNYIFGKLKTK